MLKPSSEIELKFDLEPRMVELLKSHPLLAPAGAGRTEQLVSVYFDTEASDLRKAGLSLRIRHVGERRIQGLKATAGPGIFVRTEWEREVEADRPDLGGLDETPLKDLRHAGELAERLRPIFATRVSRTTYPILHSDSEIELALDQGEVEDGTRSAPICEVELELKSGEPGRLLDFAQGLGQALPLRLAGWSKSERGYALANGGLSEPVKGEADVLSAEMDSAAAFRGIGQACLSHLTRNQHVLQETGDLEALHQMRVALRRLRSAIAIFKGMLADGRQTAIARELAWMADVLAKTRELDVFLSDVVAPAAKAEPGDSALAALLARCESRREAALRKAVDAVNSDRFRQGLLEVFAWIVAGEWSTRADEADEAHRARPAAILAAAEMEALHEKVTRKGRKLKTLDPAKRHKLRVAVKTLRYAAEFFAPVLDAKPKRQAAFRKSVAALQDELGRLNDVAASRRLAEDLAQSATKRKAALDPQIAFAAGLLAGLLAGRREAQTDALLEAAKRAFGDFAAAKPVWR